MIGAYIILPEIFDMRKYISQLIVFALLVDICLVYMFRGQFMSFIGVAILAVYFGYTIPMLIKFGKNS